MSPRSEIAPVLVILSFRLIYDVIENRKLDEKWLSARDKKVIEAAEAHAVADHETGFEKAFRVTEYYVDCGTRENGWNIGEDGPDRAEWERFKRESPFYKRFYAAEFDKETPDISGFQLPPFSANKELFPAIANKRYACSKRGVDEG